MENKIKAITVDMGSLPVDNPDELDFIELEEFPGQVMVTKKGHKRSLEIILTNAGGDIHKTIIDLKYVPSKDLTEFNVLYDMDTLVKLDTNGDYSLKHLKSSPKGLAEKEGNLLSEKDLTLYLNNDIPVKICAEPSKEKI